MTELIKVVWSSDEELDDDTDFKYYFSQYNISGFTANPSSITTLPDPIIILDSEELPQNKSGRIKPECYSQETKTTLGSQSTIVLMEDESDVIDPNANNSGAGGNKSSDNAESLDAMLANLKAGITTTVIQYEPNVEKSKFKTRIPRLNMPEPLLIGQLKNIELSREYFLGFSIFGEKFSTVAICGTVISSRGVYMNQKHQIVYGIDDGTGMVTAYYNKITKKQIEYISEANRLQNILLKEKNPKELFELDEVNCTDEVVDRLCKHLNIVLINTKRNLNINADFTNYNSKVLVIGKPFGRTNICIRALHIREVQDCFVLDFQRHLMSVQSGRQRQNKDI